MAALLRPLGYTGYLQRIIWDSLYPIPVTAYLWGGGGGGGGGDGGYRGGNGTGGGWARVDFTASPGDVIDVAVGRYGAGGAGARSSAAGGSAGASYLPSTVFVTSTSSISGSSQVSNRAWCSFLNTYGIWIGPETTLNFDRTVSVNFPSTGVYTITGSSDNDGSVYIDGSLVANIGGYTAPRSTNVAVSAGTHSVRIVATNWGGPAGVAVTINPVSNGYSGGGGGNAGASGSSGGGGGGGGATVLLLNGTEIGIAGGGAGGGGAGYRGGSGTAPGPNGQSGSATNGQSGGTNPGDGGGGGGGGGGAAGGNGGYWGGGNSGSTSTWSDTYGQGGYYGSSLGNSYASPTGRTPPDISNPYYSGVAGQGGAGGTGAGSNGENGYAALSFTASGSFVNDNGEWKPASNTYIKDAGVWKTVKGIYIKDNGIWKPVYSSSAPYFTNVAGNFGVSSRTAPQYVPPAFVEI